MMMPKRRKQSQPTLTSLHLPFDLVADILCRLPVKHLIQLSCVCKSWNSLIFKDFEFIKKQLRLSTSNHDRHHLIRLTKELVLCHSPISSIFSPASTSSVQQFNYSIGDICGRASYSIAASTCDGMICFNVNESVAVLCNPSIRKFKMLPPLKFPDQIFYHITYTLVYDRFINNYKIIALNPFSTKKEVNIHTLGTAYWRRIQDFPGSNLMPVPRTGIFVNDSVNWLAYDGGFTPFIVSFDLEKESYQQLAPPVFGEVTSFYTLGTLKGCLSLVFNWNDKFSDIWIMKEYGNEKSWNKLLCVPHISECGFHHYTRALYILEDAKVLMESDKRRMMFNKKGKSSLVVYDSISNTCNIPKFLNNNYFHRLMIPEVYIESLISPL